MARPPKSGKPLVAERRYNAQAEQRAKPAPKKRASRKKAAPRKRGLVGWILFPFTWALRLILRLTWKLGVVVALLIGAGVLYFASQMPPIEAIVDARTKGSVTLLDRDGAVFAWRGDQFGGMVTADSVSRYLHDAVVATEDKRFYGHFGISPRGIASAVRINLSEGRGPLSGNGGSTITQQVAKLLCLGVPYDAATWKTEAAYEDDCRRTTIWRKVKEAIYSMGMEVAYSKEDILTIYFNRAYLGAGSRGFEAAANRYFGKSSADVNPAESAMLAGLLKAPTSYAPTNNMQRAVDRANIVLGLMEAQGYITPEQARDARARPAQLSQAAQARAGGYFADWVMEQGPDFFTRDTTEDVVIRTTLDQRIQTAAETALTSIFETKLKPSSKAQAAVIVMSADGAVRGMVGGRDVRASGVFNRATQARRQPGSAFKPFIYATALDLGFSPNDMIDDAPLTINVPGSGPWVPENYDRKFKGPITLTQALYESRNIPAILLSEEVGRDLVRTVAQKFGIESDLAAGPALALGVSESTLLEMSGAFAGILNGGSAVQPYGLIDLRLKGETEPLMDNIGTGLQERVIQQSAARELTYMMSQVVARGTGTRAQIPGWELAGKSGTTNSARDAWFIGFNADYVIGVWMGYDDNSPMTGVTGGGLPAEIWQATMSRVVTGETPKPLPMDIPGPSTTGGVLEDTGIVADGQIMDVLNNILGGLGN
ncbi:transglycosylase domain-containing protein [Loktanella salsilacus]|jgi:penicillin-binding protein 1A|uniref:transglycosylase domain-containing protein n=1 Tax=Loktanella salsilacus TaxID=195913 RepID=UPI0020B6F95E|nr:PBP1A family penicillin-binding protein [Loktanella salsilacus]UTH43802.1 PBP1A family penicillin-binding protein [Loktanella salsilacus]